MAAIGSGKVAIAVGGRRNLTINLLIPGAADAGASEAGASEAGQPPLDTASTDAGPVVDAAALDSRLGPDAPASDAGGPDVPLSGDSGGLDGTGGNGGTGGQGGTGGHDGGIDGAGGTGGISSTGGAGGTGGTSQADAGDSSGAGGADAGSACGNGLVDISEECDDGNTLDGDHCSSVCKWEYCGDGDVQSSTLAALSLIYLARSCVTVDQDIWLVLNGQEVARGKVQQTCACQPGIVTIPLTNPTFLRLANNGTNIVEVHTHAEISRAVVHWESPTGPGETYPIDTGGKGAAQSRMPNLCTIGSEMGMESGIQISLAGGEQCDHGAKNGTAGDTCNANCTVK